MKTFLGRMKAEGACPPRKPMPAILWSWLGSLVGIYAIGSCTPLIAGAFGLDGFYLLGSFGAAAVLVYGAPMARCSQPWNLVVGNLASALVGVTVAANISSPGSAAPQGAGRDHRPVHRGASRVHVPRKVT
ncbi:MAG: HPP family protein [Planctomycetia bacterium]